MKKIRYDEYLLFFGMYDTLNVALHKRCSVQRCKDDAFKRRCIYELSESIINVQPIKGPVAKIFTLKTK